MGLNRGNPGQMGGHQQHGGGPMGGNARGANGRPSDPNNVSMLSIPK